MKGRNTFYLLAFFSLISSFLFGQNYWSDDKIHDYFRLHNVNYSIHHDTVKGIPVRYMESWKHEDKSTLIFLVHGASSQGMKFRNILIDDSLLERAHIIAFDRPGYGASNPGIPMTSIEDQTDIIQGVLNQYNFNKCILVGHSYGGAIVSNYAYRHPDKELKLILLSPAVDPDLEVVFMPDRLKDSKLAWQLLPQMSKVGISENLTHQVELLKIRNIWSQLNIPIHHIHGKMDKVIPWENSHFLKSHVPENKLKTSLLSHTGHFMLRFNKDLIIEAILEMI